MTEFKGQIAIDIREATPDWEPFLEPRAKEGAPNVLFIVWDDTGFGSWDTYGGLIRMPAMRRIAERGMPGAVHRGKGFDNWYPGFIDNVCVCDDIARLFDDESTANRVNRFLLHLPP